MFTRERTSTRSGTGLYLLLLYGFFLVLYFATTSREAGDTVRYASDVIAHATARPSQFWEFGHFLWRPWGAVGLRLFGPLFESQFHDTDVQSVTRFFIWTNFVCCLATIALIWTLIKRVTPLLLATVIAAAFCGANCFLGYAALGSAYLPALCFESLALLFLVKATEENDRRLLFSSLAGISYGISVLLWFPYAFAAAGLLTFILLWRSGPNSHLRWNWRERIPSATTFSAVAVLVASITLGCGAIAGGFRGPSGLRRWIVESDNGWSQHLNIIRAVTGIPRAIYELSSDTTLLKRWFFHDPFNPVHLSHLAGTLFLKLILFYVGMLAVLWLLWIDRADRWWLSIFLSAAAPLLFFAIFVFEPGSTSRYLPTLPFLYIAIAIAVDHGRRRRFALTALVVLLSSSVLFNAAAMTSGTWGEAARVHRLRNSLESQLSRPATVFVTTLHDEFYFVPLARPLDHGLTSAKYDVVDVIELASVRIVTWRGEFSARALESWRQGRDVWISEHLLASRPLATWPWTEGDDPRIRWTELPGFFRQFETDRQTEGGVEGFARITENPDNIAILEKQAATYPSFKSGAAPLASVSGTPR